MNTIEIIFKKLMDHSTYIPSERGMVLDISLNDLSKEIASELYKQQEEQEIQMRSVQDESAMANEPEGEQE